MEAISQRELRSDNARILRSVEAGSNFIITRRGVPVARIDPIDVKPGLRRVQPARTPLDPSALRRTVAGPLTAMVLGELRDER